MQLALDDGRDDGALVLEITVHEAGAHLRRLRDVRHAGRVKAVLDETLLRRAEDPLALHLGARRVPARADRVPDHGPRSSQPPPSALYSVTRFVCSARRVDDQRLLRQVERALRFEQHQVAVAARFVPRECEPVRLGRRIDRRLPRGALFREGRGERERVRYVAKPGLDGPLVLCQRDVAIGAGDVRFARSRPPSKIGRFDLGCEQPDPVPASNRPDNSSLAEPTEPVSLIDGKKAARAAPMFALVGAQPMLGREHVGTPQQHFGWQACGQGCKARDRLAKGLRQRSVPTGAPTSNCQRVGGLRGLTREASDVRTRGFDLRARLADVERGDRAELVPLLRQCVEFLTCRERRCTPCAAAPGRPRASGTRSRLPRSVSVARCVAFPPARNNRCSAAWLRLRTRPNRSSSNSVMPMPAVNDSVVRASSPPVRTIAAVALDDRHAVCPLDAVERPRALDVEHGHPQVTIVGERVRNHFLAVADR